MPSRIPPLAKMLAYVLGRCPDEFGLVLDADGFVPVKTLLQALAEEEGWGHVRRGHLNELVMMGDKSPVEIDADRIRSVERRHLPEITEPQDPPKELFTCIRRRAYSHVMERGIAEPPPPGLLLTEDRPMALRIGRRRDPQPILLTVRARDLKASGVLLRRFGERLYLASALPTGCFSGPPPPKEKPLSSAVAEPVSGPMPHPGSFFPNLGAGPSSPRGPGKNRHKEPEWKRQRRLDRRHGNRDA
jgi:putative RNA 2'-phosphotransferase